MVKKLKKDKTEYLRKKKLKQEAKKKEAEHQIDYDNIPDKNYQEPLPGFGPPDDESYMAFAMMASMMARSATRNVDMWGPVKRKEK